MKTSQIRVFLGKIFAIYALFGIISATLSYAIGINVVAIVGNVNHAPLVLSVTPSSNIVSVAKSGVRTFIFEVQDDENETLTYTMTPEVGAVFPSTGTIPNTASGAFFNFNYVAPAVKPVPNTKKLIVTISDGPNLITKSIQLYIY